MPPGQASQLSPRQTAQKFSNCLPFGPTLFKLLPSIYSGATCYLLLSTFYLKFPTLIPQPFVSSLYTPTFPFSLALGILKLLRWCSARETALLGCRPVPADRAVSSYIHYLGSLCISPSTAILGSISLFGSVATRPSVILKGIAEGFRLYLSVSGCSSPRLTQSTDSYLPR